MEKGNPREDSKYYLSGKDTQKGEGVSSTTKVNKNIILEYMPILFL